MKKFAASALALILATSMLFAAAPAAYASEDLPASTPPLTQPENTSAESDPTADEIPDNAEGQDRSGIEIVEEAPEQAPDVTSPGVLVEEGATSVVNDIPLASDGADGSLSVLASGWTNPILERAKALIELSRALDDLYRTLRTASGPSIVRADSGYLTEDDPTALFQEGVYYSKVVTLVNKINALLDKCKLDSGLYVIALPISVTGKLPEGFTFENNVLTLADPSLLSWNADLGDRPDSLTRSYEIKLQLNTGICYIDRWLSSKGISMLASGSFTIELQLVNLPDEGEEPGGEDVPPVIPPDPDGEDGEEDDPPVIPPDLGGDTTGNDPGTGSGTSAHTNVYATSVIVEEEPAAPETTPEVVQPPAQTNTDPAQSQTVEAQQIPMASMMVNEVAGAGAANVGLTGASVVLSAASLISLRPRKPGGSKVLLTAAQPSQLGQIMGFVGIGLGAVNAILLILSQCMVDSTNAAWTPVLAIIGIVQVACAVGLFASKKIASKKAVPSRYEVRY